MKDFKKYLLLKNQNKPSGHLSSREFEVHGVKNGGEILQI